VKHTTIILQPGEQITITAAASQPIQDTDGRLVLPVPYLSQWSPTARRAPGDCGPADLAMAIHYLTDHDPTVDEVAIAAGMDQGDQYTDFQQLAKAARQYGLSVRYVRPLTRGTIETQIRNGRPVLALVKYDILSTRDNPNQDSFKGAHFVLCVGYSDDSVIFHDSDRLSGEEFGAFREKPWAIFLQALASTSQTPGNTQDNHGMLFDA
jgi:ABC-type bacteriocin/lantibiotic exporter with double-glycine peptidase domain